jgi:hypothetical protein
MEVLTVLTLAMGLLVLMGVVIVVSVDVYRESERHRLLVRTPRYSAHRTVAPPRA